MEYLIVLFPLFTVHTSQLFYGYGNKLRARERERDRWEREGRDRHGQLTMLMLGQLKLGEGSHGTKIQIKLKKFMH
jgi:hypothetical protein